MRALVFGLFLLLVSCAAPMSETPAEAPRTGENTRVGDHIPPPPFKDDEDDDVRYCGGMMAASAQTCSGENEYCHRNVEDMCGAADAPGTCRTKPEICTQDYRPVCGCDGKTYPNECAANAKGISATSLGECKT